MLKQMYLYNYRRSLQGAKNSASEIRNILRECNMEIYYTDTHPVHSDFLTIIRNTLRENYSQSWKNEMNSMSKLEIYRTLKHEIKPEQYVKAIYLTNSQRRYIAMCRAGILPIEIEKGRWRGKPREERLCKQCNTGVVEDMNHFLMDCPKYQEIRTKYLQLDNLQDIMIKANRNLANFIYECFQHRS